MTKLDRLRPQLTRNSNSTTLVKLRPQLGRTLSIWARSRPTLDSVRPTLGLGWASVAPTPTKTPVAQLWAWLEQPWGSVGSSLGRFPAIVAARPRASKETLPRGECCTAQLRAEHNTDDGGHLVARHLEPSGPGGNFRSQAQRPRSPGPQPFWAGALCEQTPQRVRIAEEFISRVTFMFSVCDFNSNGSIKRSELFIGLRSLFKGLSRFFPKCKAPTAEELEAP